MMYKETMDVCNPMPRKRFLPLAGLAAGWSGRALFSSAAGVGRRPDAARWGQARVDGRRSRFSRHSSFPLEAKLCGAAFLAIIVTPFLSRLGELATRAPFAAFIAGTHGTSNNALYFWSAERLSAAFAAIIAGSFVIAALAAGEAPLSAVLAAGCASVLAVRLSYAPILSLVASGISQPKLLLNVRARDSRRFSDFCDVSP